MKREYDENVMLKSKGILYFPPVKEFSDAFKIFNECGGMIICLEEDGYLVEESLKISKLYDIPQEQLVLYFKDALSRHFDEAEVQNIISKWNEEDESLR